MIKKVTSIIVSAFLVGVLFLTSCTKQDHFYKDYLIERTYIGMPDSIWIKPGDQRVLIEWYTPKDGQAKDMVIRNGSDSIVVEIDHTVDKQSVIIDNLEERDYVFNAYTSDRLTNRSLLMELSTQVYGDNYREAMTDRNLSHSVVFPTDSLALVWNNLGRPETLYGAEVEFTDNSGTKQQVFSSAPDNVIMLYDVDKDNPITFRSVYRPHENAFDNFYRDEIVVDLVTTKLNTLTFSSTGYLDGYYVDFNLIRRFLIDNIPRPIGENIDMAYALGAGSRGNLFTMDGTGFSAFASTWQDRISNWDVRNYARMKLDRTADAKDLYEALDENNREQMIAAYDNSAGAASTRLSSLAVDDIIFLHSADRGIYVAMKVVGTPPPVSGALGDFTIEFKVSRP